MAQIMFPIIFLSTLKHFFPLCNQIYLLTCSFFWTLSDKPHHKVLCYAPNIFRVMVYSFSAWKDGHSTLQKPSNLLLCVLFSTVLLLPTSLIAHNSTACTKKHRPGQKQFLAPLPFRYMHFSLTILSTRGFDSYSEKVLPSSLQRKKWKNSWYKVSF